MKKKNLKIAGIIAAVLFISLIAIFTASAYFRETVVVASTSKNVSTVTLDKTPGSAVAEAPSIDTHFGAWEAGDELKATFTFKYTGDISAYAAPQLDIIGSNGTRYNEYFTGTYKINGNLYAFADEQYSETVVTNASPDVTVEYELTVNTNIDSEITITPQFSCAVLQAVHNEGIQASCRKILSGDQTGFSDSISADGVYYTDDSSLLLKDRYAAGTYTNKTLKFTVTPDDRASGHKVSIYKFNGYPGNYAGFSSNGHCVKEEALTGEQSIWFGARAGMTCKIVVDAENKEAGHTIYGYDITWPSGESPSVISTELDKNGNSLN